MDALAGLLDGPRAQGAFLLKVVLGPPWSLRIADEAPLAVFTVLDGTAWFVHPAMDGPVELAVGDTVVTCGPITTSSRTGRIAPRRSSSVPAATAATRRGTTSRIS